MDNRQRQLEEGTAAAELKGLLDGRTSKSRWLLGGMLASALVTAVLNDRFGWQLSRLQLQLGLAAVWFVVVVVLAFRQSRSAK